MKEKILIYITGILVGIITCLTSLKMPRTLYYITAFWVLIMPLIILKIDNKK